MPGTAAARVARPRPGARPRRSPRRRPRPTQRARVKGGEPWPPDADGRVQARRVRREHRQRRFQQVRSRASRHQHAPREPPSSSPARSSTSANARSRRVLCERSGRDVARSSAGCAVCRHAWCLSLLMAMRDFAAGEDGGNRGASPRPRPTRRASGPQSPPAPSVHVVHPGAALHGQPDDQVRREGRERCWSKTCTTPPRRSTPAHARHADLRRLGNDAAQRCHPLRRLRRGFGSTSSASSKRRNASRPYLSLPEYSDPRLGVAAGRQPRQAAPSNAGVQIGPVGGGRQRSRVRRRCLPSTSSVIRTEDHFRPTWRGVAQFGGDRAAGQGRGSTAMRVRRWRSPALGINFDRGIENERGHGAGAARPDRARSGRARSDGC